jgi:hypothetical protein
MATPGKKQVLSAGKNEPPKDPDVDKFVALLPELYYAVNRVLEDSAPNLSRRVAIALWALGHATKADDVGRYLTTGDLVETFGKWFVVSEDNASSTVSKLKAELFDLHQFIKIEGGKDHIHLTQRGEEAARKMIATAKRTIESTLAALSPEEQCLLLEYAVRMIATQRKPVVKASVQPKPPESHSR